MRRENHLARCSAERGHADLDAAQLSRGDPGPAECSRPVRAFEYRRGSFQHARSRVRVPEARG